MQKRRRLSAAERYLPPSLSLNIPAPTPAPMKRAQLARLAREGATMLHGGCRLYELPPRQQHRLD